VAHKTLWSIVVFGNISYLGSDASPKRTTHQMISEIDIFLFYLSIA